MSTAKIIIEGKEYECPIVEGTEQEKGIDVTSLRAQSGYITYDPGYANTGSCSSSITFIDGEKGILRYRGYPIEELAERAKFPEVCYLLIYDHLPDHEELMEWRRQLTLNSFLPQGMVNLFDHFPYTAHPMSVLSSMVGGLSFFYPDVYQEDPVHADLNIVRLLAKAKTIAAFSYRKTVGLPAVHPKTNYSYAANFLRMMFSNPAEDYDVPESLERALNLLLIVHADHEQNCSTSTVRMVGSSRANFFASMSAAIGALWGPLHGGANQAVIEMLQQIRDENIPLKKFVEQVKDKSSNRRLMGFGHRVYKNFDPRATILRKANDEVLAELGISDPLLDIAKELEQVAIEDDYFRERKLYPNVDFYSGILYRAMGIPTEMFTVMFALGRMPGWIAHWKEMRDDPATRIHRPRQIYVGQNERHFEPLEQRPHIERHPQTFEPSAPKI
jgi:citrate synthase